MRRIGRTLASLAIASAVVVALTLTTAGSALAYGNAAAYQVEISANWHAPGTGFGVWLWIELDADGTGDYQGADCAHGLAGPGSAGAVHDGGEVTWTSDGTTLTINGVFLNGPGFPATITVPATYGHTKTTLAAVLNVPFPGWAQVQVAP